MHLLEKPFGEHGRVLLPEASEMNPPRLQSRKTVLLAEDDDDLRYVMECTLTAMGFVVVACADAQLASTAFLAQPAVDILLTDFEMPRKSGLELARELTVLRPTLPVMIITGSLLSPAAVQEMHQRRWIYVSKPCHLPALESTLKELLMTERSAAAA